MTYTIVLHGQKFEQDFLSSWIKYNRLKQEISQDALAHGICSTSHLSYFENGKKPLRPEIIEALLNKLQLDISQHPEHFKHLRHTFHKFLTRIEGFEFIQAHERYEEIVSLSEHIQHSPYEIEYQVHTLAYKIMVCHELYHDLEDEVIFLDKLYTTFPDALKFTYLLTTGKLIYDHHSRKSGLDRLRDAYQLRQTAWIEYRLGVAYTYDNNPLKGIEHLERALNAYESTGRYYNALSCHTFLARCHTALENFDTARYHCITILDGSELFSMNKNIWGVFNQMAQIDIQSGRYEESLKWSAQAIQQSSVDSTSNTDPWRQASWRIHDERLIGVMYQIEAYLALGQLPKCKELLALHLVDDNKNERYYLMLMYYNLLIYHFQEDLFYTEMTDVILPYYTQIGYLNLARILNLKLAEYLESKRRYKEANQIYKTMIK